MSDHESAASDSDRGNPDAEIQSESSEEPVPHVSIFKIPNSLKDTKREAYVPQGVSLGPYHHGSEKLTAMDLYKRSALLNMMTRFNNARALDKENVAFAHLASTAILEKEHDIRNSYEEGTHWDGNRLPMMLSFDGCFILEVLKTLDKRDFQPGRINAPIFGENMIAASNTVKDILMLENQIPWIVLVELQHVENSAEHLFDLMVRITCRLFKISQENGDELSRVQWLESAVKEVPHLLGFLHKVIVHLPSYPSNPGHIISIESCICRCLQMHPDKNKALNHDFEGFPTAVELKNAGFKFRPYNGGIAQIYFDSSTIYLPLLSITDNTEVLFRNFIAYEMCRTSEGNYVISYVNLMDDLIHSQKDVAFLRSMGILTNELGSDKEVAGLFNGLFKGVTVRMPDSFADLRKVVKTDYKNRCGKCKNRIRDQLAEFLRDHFSSPCKALTWAVAAVTLCLAIIQTVYAVKKK